MSDPAKYILKRLRRYPYCIACAIVALFSAAGAWYLREEIEQLQVAYNQRAAEGNAMLAMLVSGSTLRQELTFARTTVRRIEENLVVPSNLADNLWYFYKLEEQTKARLPELHQLSSVGPDKSRLFRSVPYSLRITGGYDEVAGYLQALETGPRLLRITSFNYARSTAVSSTLSLDLTLEVLGKK
jgi:Tfp pilus assembly protein PilO